MTKRSLTKNNKLRMFLALERLVRKKIRINNFNCQLFPILELRFRSLRISFHLFPQNGPTKGI